MGHGLRRFFKNAPDYRLGWLEGGRFSHEIRRLKFTASATESVLLSDTIGSYMLSGGYDRHLRALRRIYKSNIETIRGLVASHYPEGTRATQPDGGFILWLELPTHVHATALFRQALEREVVFMPGELYSDGPRFIIACESRAAEPRMMNLSMRSSLLVLSRSEAVRKCSPGGRAIGM
jgi:DNA-binding transcriptional MocR family regulator